MNSIAPRNASGTAALALRHRTHTQNVQQMAEFTKLLKDVFQTLERSAPTDSHSDTTSFSSYSSTTGTTSAKTVQIGVVGK